MGTSNTVIAYNFLAALSETKKELFKDVYIPFCKRALSLYNSSGNKEGTDQDIRDLIKERFNLDIPVIVVRQLIIGVKEDLSRSQIQKTKFEIFENGHSFQMETFTFSNLEEQFKKAERESNLLQESFEQFVSELGIEEEVPTLASFIDKNRAEVTSFFANGVMQSKDLEDKSYLIHVEFLEHIEVHYHVLYKIAERIFLGSLIASFIEANIDLEEKFKTNIDYYIDTQLVLRALDLQNEPETQPAIDLFSIIKKSGGNLNIFDETLDEISQVLDYTIEKYDQENPTTTINEACIRKGKNKAWLISLNHNLRSEIEEKFKISLKKIPLSFKKEVEKTDDLKDLKEQRSNESNALHDVMCYLRVRYLRGGKIRSSKKASAWFVSPNKRLFNFNKSRCLENGITEIVTPEPLTAMLWLKDIDKLRDDVKKTGLSEIISQTISEEVASRDLIISFEKNLKASPNVTDEEYQALISTVAHESAKKISQLNELLESEEYDQFESEAGGIIERDRTRKKKYVFKFKELLSQNNISSSKIDELIDKNKLLEKELLEKDELLKNKSEQLNNLRDQKKKTKKSFFILLGFAVIGFSVWKFDLIGTGLPILKGIFEVIISVSGLWAFFNFLINFFRFISNKKSPSE